MRGWDQQGSQKTPNTTWPNPRAMKNKEGAFKDFIFIKGQCPGWYKHIWPSLKMLLCYRANKGLFFKPSLPLQEMVRARKGSCLPVVSVLTLLQVFFFFKLPDLVHHVKQALLRSWPHFSLQWLKNKDLLSLSHRGNFSLIFHLLHTQALGPFPICGLFNT